MITAKILPFFMQIDDDRVIIEECLNRMRVLASIRLGRHPQTYETKHNNAEKMEELYKKLLEELDDQYYFVNLYSILEYAKKMKSNIPIGYCEVITCVVE